MAATQEEKIPVRTTTPRQLRDTPVDVKLVLSALWIAMLFVFAYVDIFGFYRADILDAALDGKVATTALMINQMFLTGALIYILIPSVMAVLALVLRPRVNRMTNVVVSLLYSLTIVYFCRGETWVYYLVGSAVEVVLLLAIARTAWKWPPPQIAPSRS
ncbi:DUF6326 family protein [Nocardioides sp. InS609-2]|uniref:DUF6326 family protein n=1 Tax=Nocardioides sp. InS609-2 TaxID=2760705 RepID=UPI0020C054D6|nr:DUF6326 family protein [Nocardioides sp. InS609-2]